MAGFLISTSLVERVCLLWRQPGCFGEGEGGGRACGRFYGFLPVFSPSCSSVFTSHWLSLTITVKCCTVALRGVQIHSDSSLGTPMIWPVGQRFILSVTSHLQNVHST